MIYKIKTIKIQYAVSEANTKNDISSSEKAFNILKEIYKDLDVDQEHFCLLTLNRRNIITGYKILFCGGQTATLSDPKILFRNALLLGATGIIIAHNHPAGITEPSEDDLTITKQIHEGAKILDIKLYDHIIIGNNSDNFYSFADKGLLTN